MIEKPTHLDAFEKYFAMGDKRSYTELARILPYSRTSIKNWGKAHNWKERVQLRDIEVAKQVEKKTTTSTVSIKAKRLKEVSDLHKILGAAIQTAVRALKAGDMEVKTEAGLERLILSKDRLVKLEQLLIGESTENETITIKVDVDE